MDNGSITPVLPVGTGTDGFGGGNAFIWIFGLLILMSMFNGGFGNNSGYHPQYATQQDVQYTSQFAQLLDGNRDIINNITSGTAQAVATTNQAKYDTINVAKDIQSNLMANQSEIKVGQANSLAKMNECCCNTLRAIDNVNYTNAMNTASINENTTAQTQKILDAITSNRIADMQNQINALQLQSATSNVLRFPNAWTFNGGYFPPLTPPTTTTNG
jgi:hypothetical protein